MLTVLRQQNYALLWLGQLISTAGDWVLFIALPFYVFSLTGSALATGVMFIVETLPRVLLGSVAGVYVDRWDRRRTMIVADVLRGFLLLAMLAVHSVGDLWIVYVVAVLQSTIAQFFTPARNAILPRLVGPADLVSANALNSIGDNFARLTAPALGGALLGQLGLASVVLVDSTSFLFSALMIFCVVVPAANRTTFPTSQPAGISLWREWLEGLRVVRSDRVLSTIFLQFAFGMVGEGILDVLFVPFVKERLQGDALTLAWLMSAQAVGSLLAGGMVSRLSKSVTPARLIAFGAIGWGVFDAIIFNVPLFWLALAFFIVVGIPIVAMNVSVNAVMQHRSADRYRGRIFGAYGAVGSLMLVLGMSASTLLGDRVGVLPLLNIACVLMVLSGLVVWVRLPATA